MAKDIRLDKYIAEAAGITRKDAKTALQKGRVRVNGEVCKNGDAKVSSADEVTLDGKSLAADEFLYLMLHKPAGVVSATEDGRDKTVLDLVKEQSAEAPEEAENTGYFLGKREFFPVGRLDKDTEGLLLLTDDGELAHKLLSPNCFLSVHTNIMYRFIASSLIPANILLNCATVIPANTCATAFKSFSLLLIIPSSL